MKTHAFNERFAFADAAESTGGVLDLLVRRLPGARDWRRAAPEDDRAGTDYWIRRLSGPPLSIDFKHRSFCPIEQFGTDDACIETTSRYVGPKAPPFEDRYRATPGWSLDEGKRTDLVCYTWPRRSGGVRFWCVPFPLLFAASQHEWREWAKRYGERAALNDTYATLSIYVPRTVILAAIDQRMAGEI